MSKTTDPHKLPDADPHTGELEIDPITGYDTTGHVWGHIKELNTPFPKIAVWALVLAFAYSVVAWILLPAWPLGRDYTRGVLGLSQGDMAMERFEKIDASRQGWKGQFAAAEPDFAALANDPAVLAQAMSAAARLFDDNCAACHGVGGVGGPGYPVLDDGYWLWGGDPATIAETVTLGINATENADTRYSEMPPFDWMEAPNRKALAKYVAALPSGKADANGPAAQLFAENCASCHNDGGIGGMDNGAPSLTDHSVIYGQDEATIMHTLRHGRQGDMPSWASRLNTEDINMLALYVSRLAKEDAEPSQ
ncbi:cytochrome-c oxidase, cbb3-type subunit III [Aquicoccus sp. G2-2]|uniref:cytochrome-c oxidase, cbb3-type subunit III n=1 Tax=Aquicoccus sp. G2-2 TaxID=3092120 RepID=UPI002ADFFBE6|nr:cytochrome-c oxidase, cbb3-type subunit III [Aquicoccus sp. G2-2]MEA1113507.1 cytochrome-c oxidase, cbb3-type subunit III [Aquicoccus sp. G2-2]